MGVPTRRSSHRPRATEQAGNTVRDYFGTLDSPAFRAFPLRSLLGGVRSLFTKGVSPTQHCAGD